MGKCSDFLEEHLDVDNCLEIKDFANFQVGCEKLRLAAETFAGKAFQRVHKTPKIYAFHLTFNQNLSLVFRDSR